ncbi:MAG: hypothetical protein ATN33_00115 [Epulopiscium sp. Nele67-Bin001]|nr:MAG: hypothetical protein ATN33_00115 [Epulopiscium sp. Nele67-Bin001]
MRLQGQKGEDVGEIKRKSEKVGLRDWRRGGKREEDSLKKKEQKLGKGCSWEVKEVIRRRVCGGI